MVVVRMNGIYAKGSYWDFCFIIVFVRKFMILNQTTITNLIFVNKLTIYIFKCFKCFYLVYRLSCKIKKDLLLQR